MFYLEFDPVVDGDGLLAMPNFDVASKHEEGVRRHEWTISNEHGRATPNLLKECISCIITSDSYWFIPEQFLQQKRTFSWKTKKPSADRKRLTEEGWALMAPWGVTPQHLWGVGSDVSTLGYNIFKLQVTIQLAASSYRSALLWRRFWRRWDTIRPRWLLSKQLQLKATAALVRPTSRLLIGWSWARHLQQLFGICLSSEV